MGNRYQRPITSGSGAISGFKKNGIGMLFATMCARLGIGAGEKKSTGSTLGTGAGYQPQSNLEDIDDDRIIRHRQKLDPVTGTYVIQDSEPPKRKRIWLWTVLTVAAIVLFSFAFNHRDAVNIAPPANPDSAAAMADAIKPTDNARQNITITNAPVITQSPTPTYYITPAPSPTPTPTANSNVLKYGSKGEAVKNLQDQLIALGYIALGQNDGAFGEVTQVAVQSFQKENSLEADGIAGDKTLALLNGGTAKQDPDVFVWVEAKGKEYHSSKDCSDMKDPKQIKLSQAEKRKLKPCEKCH